MHKVGGALSSRVLRSMFFPRTSEVHFVTAVWAFGVGMLINADVFIADAGDVLHEGFIPSFEYFAGMLAGILAVVLLGAYVIHRIRNRAKQTSPYERYSQGVVYYTVMAFLAILASPSMTYFAGSGKLYTLNLLVINILNVIYAARFIWVYFGMVTRSKKAMNRIIKHYSDAQISKWQLGTLVVVGVCAMVILKIEQYSVSAQIFLAINYSLSIVGVVRQLQIKLRVQE